MLKKSIKNNLKKFCIKNKTLYLCSPLEIAGFFYKRKADVAQLARAADL